MELIYMTLMFQGNADFFMRFFERCQKENLNTEKERADLLVVMAKETGECSISHTERSKEEITKDLAKHYGHILKVSEEDGDGE